jgi:hypothetical protein
MTAAADEQTELRRLIAGLEEGANGRYRHLPVTSGDMCLIAKYLRRLLRN